MATKRELKAEIITLRKRVDEQAARVDEQAARVSALAARVAALEGMSAQVETPPPFGNIPRWSGVWV